MDAKRIEYVVYIGIALTFLLIFYNFYTTLTLMEEVDKKLEEAKEAQKLPMLKVTVIDDGCLECREYSSLLDAIKQLNANVSVEELSSAKASSLISKYSIARIPSIVIEGDLSVVENSQLSQLFRREGEALVFESLPPYYDLGEKKVRGIVEAIVVEHKGCEECFNMRNIIDSLENAGVIFADLKAFEHPGEEANALLSTYNATTFPFLLISKEIDLYGYKDAFASSPLIEDVGEYYLVKPFPPYLELPSLKMRGEIEAIYLTSRNCENCMDVNIFRDGIGRMGLYIKNETVLYIEDERGKELVNMYNISFVPTVILIGDVEAYEGLKESWQRYGKAIGNALIYTDYESITQNYFDIENNRTIIQEGSQ